MRRFALAILIALLTFCASGAYALLVAEPCSTYEQAGRTDDACPPTCATCGCCAQAFEPMLLPVTAGPETLVSEISPAIPQQPTSTPRDILHVPKLRLA